MMMRDSYGFIDNDLDIQEIQCGILYYKECNCRVDEIVIICDYQMVFKYVISKEELSTRSVDELLNLIPSGNTLYGAEIYLDYKKKTY